MRILNILFNHNKATHDNQVFGVERCFIDYSKYFVKFGHNVVSVVQKGISYIDKVEQCGCKVETMSAFARFDVLTIFKMTKLFYKFRPEIVLCHSKRALYFVRIAKFLTCSKAPLIVINHGIKVEKFLKADYVLAVNSYFTQKLIEAGMPKNRAVAVPNMIEVAQDYKFLEKPQFRKPLKLGSLGRIYPEKNFDKVLYAMKILKDQGFECEYVIGGVGTKQKELEELARDLGLEKNFKVLGWTDDKKTFFENIDIFMLPSSSETFGIVLLEAMLYNTPIITSNSWGPEEIIDHEIDGIKVSKDDAKKMPELLAREIMRLNNDQEFAKKLAINAHKKFFEKYEANVVISGLEKLFVEILKGKR